MSPRASSLFLLILGVSSALLLIGAAVKAAPSLESYYEDPDLCVARLDANTVERAPSGTSEAAREGAQLTERAAPGNRQMVCGRSSDRYAGGYIIGYAGVKQDGGPGGNRNRAAFEAYWTGPEDVNNKAMQAMVRCGLRPRGGRRRLALPGPQGVQGKLQGSGAGHDKGPAPPPSAARRAASTRPCNAWGLLRVQ